MAPLLIIGYGNPLRRDDGFGWHAARRLRESMPDRDVEVLTVQQLTPELMEPVSRAGRVIFIDARAGGEAGTLLTRPVEPDRFSGTAFTHFATPAALLGGAAELYGAHPEAVLITCAGADFGFGDELSAPVQAALDRLAIQAP